MVDTSDIGTVEQVRLALGDTDGSIYEQAIIERTLEWARRIVEAEADADAAEPLLEEAVISMAAWKTATTVPHTTRKEAADVLKEWDTETYLADLKADAEEALDRVNGSEFLFEAY